MGYFRGVRRTRVAGPKFYFRGERTVDRGDQGG